MKILAVEGNWWDRNQLSTLLKKALPDAQICVLDNTAEALEYAKGNALAAAFIDMGKSVHVPGFFLAKKILELQRTNVILTNYEWEHTQEALALRVSGYIRKPLRYEDVLTELQNLRYPLAEAGKPPIQPSASGTQRKLLGKISSLYCRRTRL